MPSPVRRLLPALAFILLFLTACEVGAEISIDVEEDGSGTVETRVTLDSQAIGVIGEEALEDQLAIADLEATGWLIDGPFPDDDGVTVITGTKAFSTADQMQAVLDELMGANGPLRNFELTTERAFGETTYQLDGVIDFSGGIGLLGDADLLTSLDGNVLGRPVSEIEAEYGDPIEEIFPILVRIDVPGAEVREYVPTVVDTEPIDVDIMAVQENLIAKLWKWVGWAALILFAVSLVITTIGYIAERRIRARQPKFGSPESMRTRVPVGATAASGAATGRGPASPQSAVRQGSTGGPKRKLRLVVLDSMGVLFNTGDDPGELLIPFVHEHGGGASDNEIEEAHRLLTLGRMNTGEFWEEVGVDGEPLKLNEDYLRYIKLASGTTDFLKEMRRRDLAVAVVSNDASDWSQMLRDRHGLSVIEPWIVSAEVGVRKPDPGIYEALRRTTGVPYENCLMIDGRLSNLDAAKTLGMSTAWFTSQRPSPDQRPPHPVVMNFSEFFRRR